MATGIAKPSIRTNMRRIHRSHSARFAFTLALVVALFASATTAFGVAPTSRYTRISVTGDTYALAGTFQLDGNSMGVLGTSTDDGANWSLGMAQGAFWGATAWNGGPVWGSMTLNRGLWAGLSPFSLQYKNPPSGPTYEWRDVTYDGTAVMAVGMRTASPYGPDAQPATIWRSTNGGDSWTEALRAPDYAPTPGNPVPAQPAAMLEAVDSVPNLAVAVGTEFPQEDFNYLGAPKQALIYRSTDGGSSWTTQTAGITIQMLDVDVVDTNVVWAVGSTSKVLRSLDGGATWQNWNVGKDFNTATNLGVTTFVPTSVAGVDGTK